MKRWAVGTCLAWLLAAGTARAADDLAKETLLKVKEASVYVEVETARGGGSGSGFFIKEEGLLITNHHVVTDDPKKIQITLNAGNPKSEKFDCSVVAVDDDYDLALVKVNEPKGRRFTSLTLGKSEDLIETAKVWAFGFPLGTMLDQSKFGPAISVNEGAVSALRYNDDGKLEVVQHDATVTFGNSGGALVDSKGQVIGVIVGGVTIADINMAIPTWMVQTMYQPRVRKVTFDPAVMKKKGESVTLTAEISAPFEKASRLVTELHIPGQAAPQKVMMSEIGGGKFQGKFSTPDLPSPRRLQVVVQGDCASGKMKPFPIVYADQEADSGESIVIYLGDGHAIVIQVPRPDRPDRQGKDKEGKGKGKKGKDKGKGTPVAGKDPEPAPSEPVSRPDPPAPVEPTEPKETKGPKPSSGPAESGQLKLLFDVSNDHYTVGGKEFSGGGGKDDPVAFDFFVETTSGLKQIGSAKDNSPPGGGSRKDGWTALSYRIELGELPGRTAHLVFRFSKGKGTGHIQNLRAIYKGKPVPARDHGLGILGDAGAPGQEIHGYLDLP